MTDKDTPDKARGMSPRLTMLLVVTAFVAPILVAYWFVLVPPESGDLTNRGILISPPVSIRTDPDYVALKSIALEPAQWAMIAVNPGRCEDDCAGLAGKLRTIDTVLGHDATRVQIAILTDEAGRLEGVPGLLVEPRARAALSAVLEKLDGGGPAGVVFLDWRGQIMLYFEPERDPGDIKRDLKRLLRGSKIR